MAYGTTPEGNNPKPISDPPLNAEKTGSKTNPRPMAMRRPNNNNKLIIMGGLGLIAGFAWLKSRAVAQKSEEAKRLSQSGFKEGANKTEKNYHVSVERSGGGV